MKQYKKADPTPAETLDSLRRVIAKYDLRAIEARRLGRESVARMWEETANSLRYCADRDRLAGGVTVPAAHALPPRCLVVRA
jgi:hypothetical protein